MRRPIPAIAAIALAVAAAACGSDSSPRSAGTTSTSPSSTQVRRPGPTYACATAGPPGYRVHYPKQWFVNDPSEARPCGFFHPRQFTVPQATEAPHLAIHVRVEDVPFALAAPPPGLASTEEVLQRRDEQVDGRRAARLTTRSTGDGLLPAGTESVRHVVDLGDKVLIAATSDVASGTDLEESTQVLDAMLASLEVLDAGEEPCSAGAQPARPDPAARLPDPVRDTRARIVEAASQCDFEALSAVAAEGDERFTYSFGDTDGDPADYWQQAEARGERSLEILVELLDRPFARRDGPSGSSLIVWPSAYGFDTWDAVPVEDRAALRPLYDDDDFEQFDRAGTYLGHRVGVTTAGDWIFYVAGD